MSSIIKCIKDDTKYFCYSQGVDMRKGIHSLYHLIKMSSDLSALNGDWFVFIGSSRKSLKILWWQKDGFAMYCKKLEIGCYNIPKQDNDSPFFELKSNDLDQVVNKVRYKSISNELRLNAIANL